MKFGLLDVLITLKTERMIDLKTGECTTVCDPLLPIFMPEAMFTDKEVEAVQDLAKKFKEDE